MAGGGDGARGSVHSVHCFILAHPALPASRIKRLTPAKLIAVSKRVTRMAARLEGRREGKQLDEDVERVDLCMGVVSMASLQQRILTTVA